MSDYAAEVSAALIANQWHFDHSVQQKMVRFLELLAHWNKAFNLTAIRNIHDQVYLHLADSLSILPYLRGNRIIDIGTGAGLPGIPLALAAPEKAFTLLDSNGKKTRFLLHVVHALGLPNVTVIHARCEDFHPSVRFDSIISRAFARLADMLNVTAHLCAPHGEWLAMKGQVTAEEWIGVPAGYQAIAQPLEIKGIVAARSIVRITRESINE